MDSLRDALLDLPEHLRRVMQIMAIRNMMDEERRQMLRAIGELPHRAGLLVSTRGRVLFVCRTNPGWRMCRLGMLKGQPTWKCVDGVIRGNLHTLVRQLSKELLKKKTLVQMTLIGKGADFVMHDRHFSTESADVFGATVRKLVEKIEI